MHLIMNASKITKFVNSYLLFCTAGENPGGADGNLLTNWVDDGEIEDENDISLYSDEELHERFKKLLEYFEKKNPTRNLKGITPESDEIPELTREMSRDFFGVDLGSSSK